MLRPQMPLVDAAASDTLPSPFLPSKVPGSSRWKAPLIGRRVWKKLFVASNFGKDYPLPEGPKGKEEKLIAREEARLKAEKEPLELLDLARQHWPPATPVSGLNTAEKTTYLKAKGPYKGRYLGEDGSRAFKGHKWEAAQKARHQMTEQRLARMDRQVADFKKVRDPF
jgi:hypothetical protein